MLSKVERPRQKEVFDLRAGWLTGKKETTSSVCRLQYHCLNKSNTDYVAVKLLEEVEST